MKNPFFITISFLFLAMSLCGCKSNSNSPKSDTPQEGVSNEINSKVENLKANCHKYGMWISDIGKADNFRNGDKCTLTSELYYNAEKERFFIRELYLYNDEVYSDDVYSCQIKYAKSKLIIEGVDDECIFEISSDNRIEGLFKGYDDVVYAEGTIQFDDVKSLIKSDD